MNDQVAVLESIRDVLSGKASAQPTEQLSAADEAEILDLTKLVNDDGSITDLAEIEKETATENSASPKPEQPKEEEMTKVSTTTGDDVLDEIDRLLAGDSTNDASDSKINETVEEMIESLEPISDDSIELELTEEGKKAENEFEPNPEPTATIENEEIMTENNSAIDESLISDASADKAKSAIADLLKVTGKEKAPAPAATSPSFRNGDTVEDLVMESLKPMLAKWLDENLNSLVEEIVQREISRIIPK